MKSLSFRITARFTIKTVKPNVKKTKDSLCLNQGILFWTGAQCRTEHIVMYFVIDLIL